MNTYYIIDQKKAHMRRHTRAFTTRMYNVWPLTLFFIDLPFNAFANRADPDQDVLCLILKYNV